MAKKSNKPPKIKTLDNSVSASLSVSKKLSVKEINKEIRKLERAKKRAANDFLTKNYFQSFKDFNSQTKAIEKLKHLKNGRIQIKYGNVTFNENINRLSKIKKKDIYLDKLFKNKVGRILNKAKAPTTTKEAKSLEGLITLYHGKLSKRDFYNSEITQNSINKLTNFRNKLNTYNYSDSIYQIKNQIENDNREQEIKDRLEILYSDTNIDSNIDEILKLENELYSDNEEEELKPISGGGLPIDIPEFLNGTLIGITVNFF